MQQRIIYPDKDKWSELRLTPEEKVVYNRFNAFDFPVEWEMYIHPHLNGLCPDLILLHPEFGIAVYEFIKERNLQKIKNAIESDKSALTIHNPFKKVEFYEKELLAFYCPRLGVYSGSDYSPAITVGLIFTTVSQKEIDSLKVSFVERLKAGHIFTDAPQKQKDLLVARLDKYPLFYPIVGRDNLDNLDKLFPYRERHLDSYAMVESAAIISEEGKDTAADIRAWLTESAFTPKQWAPLNLNEDQIEIAENGRSTRYRRVKGPAGSGRSVALTARAVKLDINDKRVLVCTYNITLVNYLRYLIARHARNQADFFRRQVEVFYFHDWCLHVCHIAGRVGDYTKFLDEIEDAKVAMEKAKDTTNYSYLREKWQKKKDDVFHYQIPALVQDIYNNPPPNDILPRYDAILVDEGQDFRLNWWNTLRESVKSEGERLLVADKTQDIYENAAAWTDGPMPGAGFAGTWMQLTTHYRLPSAIVKVLENMKKMRNFQEFDVPSTSDVAEFNLFPVHLRWVQTDSEKSIDVCFDEVLRQRDILQRKDLHEFSDITFLSPNNFVGSQFVEKCENYDIGVRDTFGDDNLSRLKKRLFFPGDSRMKATTLHSFKGFESSHLVVYVDRIDWPNTRALLYVGLTRLKTHPNGSMLTVVSSCSDIELCKFGRDNFEFVFV